MEEKEIGEDFGVGGRRPDRPTAAVPLTGRCRAGPSARGTIPGGPGGPALVGPLLVGGLQRRLARLIIAEAQRVSAVPVGLFECGLNVQRRVGVRLGQGKADSRQPLTEAPPVEFKPPPPGPAVHASQVVIVGRFPNVYFRDAHHVAAAPDQIDLNQMGFARPDLALLSPVGAPPGAVSLVGGTDDLNDGHDLHVAVAVEDVNGPFVDLQGIDFQHQGGVDHRLGDGRSPHPVSDPFHMYVGDARRRVPSMYTRCSMAAT